jgi:hypothetical protein
MIKDIKSPSVEDLVEAFKARKKNVFSAKDAADAERQAKQQAYEIEQAGKSAELRELVVRITKGLVEIGQLGISPMNKTSFLVGQVCFGKLDFSNGYTRGCAWKDKDVWKWHLQFQLRHHARFSWTGTNLDELTLKLCEHVGEALAWFERHPEK